MRKNPLLYSDYKESEDINTIEPIEEKRSFIFYFIVLANSLLVIVVLLVIWSLFSKSSDTSFDQQLKTWTQQFFNGNEKAQMQAVTAPAKIAPQITIDLKEEQAAAKEKELAQLKLEKERAEKEKALQAEQARLEALALELKEEQDKADAIQKTIDTAKKAAPAEQVKAEPSIAIVAKEEAAVVPNAAQDIVEQPSSNAKTQLDLILETMKNQKQ